MICKKDDGTTGESTGWYLLSADDEYLLYPVEEIEELDRTETREDRCVEFVENVDSVSHPSYYADGWSNGAEVIDLAEHLSFCAGNAVKYVCRAGRKDPDKHVEDLEKARWYIDREIERVKRH